MKRYRVKVEGKIYEVEVEEVQEIMGAPALEPKREEQREVFVPEKKPAPSPPRESTGKETPITAPMAGTIISVLVKEGQEVVDGEALLILEAMKMENEISAPISGIIKSIRVNPQQTVESGQLLVEME